MNDYTRKELRINSNRLLDSQQMVVRAMGTFDEAMYFLGTMMGSYHFNGMPEDFEKSAKDFNSRMVKIHNEMIHLCDDMMKVVRKTYPDEEVE